VFIRVDVQHLKFCVVAQDVEKLGFVNLCDVTLVNYTQYLIHCHVSFACDRLTDLAYDLCHLIFFRVLLGTSLIFFRSGDFS